MISKRSVGVLLGLIVLIALGTLVQDFTFDARITRERASALTVDRDLGSIDRLIGELRAAQAGYVATGQAPATWMTRATEAFSRLLRAVETRKSAAPNADARAKYEAALQAINSLASIDARARASISQDDRLHAADLIYIDGQQAAEAASSELAAARVLEEQAAAQRLNRWTMYRLAMNGLAIVLISVIALYFGRALSILRATPATSTAQMIRDLPPPVKGTTTLNISGPVAQPAAQPAAPAGPAVIAAAAAASSRPVSLVAAAELCVDLARILDGRDVPALLERTASLLDAKGIMIWSVETGGALLRPSMCHGYSERVLAKLRPIQVDADNVTSLAFRSMQPQTLPGATPADSGAIAIPLITATGCVGVLAAEVRQSRPHPDLVPIAQIVAAQFSTLVAPVEAQQASAQR